MEDWKMLAARQEALGFAVRCMEAGWAKDCMSSDVVDIASLYEDYLLNGKAETNKPKE